MREMVEADVLGGAFLGGEDFEKLSFPALMERWLPASGWGRLSGSVWACQAVSLKNEPFPT
ncbi:hypothetical protein GCM10010167_78170 [Paractinoplanes deccanensis]